MDWKNKYIWIAAVVVVLMVVFGRSPISAINDKKNAWKKGKDPLIVSIQEHQKDSRKGGVLGGGSGRFKTANPYENGVRSPKNAMPAPPASSSPNDYTPKAQPGLQSPNNGYYPPPPENGSKSNAVGGAALGPRSERTRLADGRQLAFNGTHVYTVNEDGKKIMLKDGNYTVFNGKIPIYVRGGHRVTEPD